MTEVGRAVRAARGWWIPGSAAAGVAAVAMYVSGGRSLWIDEAYSLLTVQRPLPEVVSRSITFELQPPVYFVLLHLWMWMGGGILLARALSTTAAVLVVFVFWKAGDDLGEDGRAWAVLAALCPSILWAASEARVYALAILLTSLATWLFLRAWILQKEPVRRARVAYVVTAVLGILTFYYVAFVIALHVVAGLWLSRERRSLIGWSAPIVLFLALWSPIVVGQAGAHPELLGAAMRPTSDPAGVVAGAARLLRLGVLWMSPVTGRWIVGLAALVILCVVVAPRRHADTRDRAARALGVAAVGTLVILTLLASTGVSLVAPRHATILAPLWLMWVAATATGRIPGRTRWVAVAGLWAILGVCSWSYAHNARDSLNWKDAVEYIRSQGGGEPIAVFPSENTLVLSHYVEDERPTFGIPVPARLDRFEPYATRVDDAAEIRPLIGPLLADGGRVWVLVHEVRGLGYDVLSAYLRTEVRVLARRRIGGIEVIRIAGMRGRGADATQQ